MQKGIKEQMCEFLEKKHDFHVNRL